ncbi:MAG: GxxExxY protein [Bacteroidota bacterium]|nr:GxxExxY protein [Bacteroidota bacterium]
MEKKIYDNNTYPLQDETEKIIQTGIEIHKILGAGFLEIVYKDAFEYEYRNQDILYVREKDYIIQYKKAVLPHKFYVDFVVFDKVIVEIKAKAAGIAEEDYAQTINYLKCSDAKLV